MRFFRYLSMCFLIAAVPSAFLVAAPQNDADSEEQTSRKPSATLEPGQAEAATTSGQEAVPTPPTHLKWSHPEVEFRGIWIPIPKKDRGVSTQTLRKQIEAFAKANFNAVLPVTYVRGYASYPDSKYLPQLPEVRGLDPLGFIIEEAHRNGLEVHAWLEFGFYAYHTPDATKDKSMGPWLDAHPELLSVNADGERYIHNPAWGDFYSMCPANPRSHEFLANLAVEIVERYPVEGINLDRIRFAGAKFCYCDYCKEHFKKDTGKELVPFAKGSVYEKLFTEWKRRQLVRAVRTIRERVKAVKPNVALTSYVVPPDEKDDKAQPWDLWARERLLDGIAVSMYGRHISESARKAVTILDRDKDLLIAAISCDVPTYVANIEKARSYAPMGQITWYSGEVMDDLEALAQGPYAKPARSPFARNAETTSSVSVPSR